MQQRRIRKYICCRRRRSSTQQADHRRLGFGGMAIMAFGAVGAPEEPRLRTYDVDPIPQADKPDF
jgi:hypothetical protein